MEGILGELLKKEDINAEIVKKGEYKGYEYFIILSQGGFFKWKSPHYAYNNHIVYAALSLLTYRGGLQHVASFVNIPAGSKVVYI